MGWFSDIVSSATSFISEKVVKPAVRAAKTAASMAIHFMADKAEKLVGKVKEVWKRVKPYVEKAQAPLRALIPKATNVHPYLGVALGVLATGVDALLALENSEVANNLEKAIKEVAKTARELQQQIRDGKIAWLTPEEYEAAIKTRKDLRAAEKETDALSEKDRKAVEFASALNDFGLAKTDVKNAIEGEPSDFEHYLRLRATQKLLGEAESKLLEGGIDSLKDDDWFLVRVASDLIKASPELKKRAAERLDSILGKTKGKTLQSFVYEELVAAWEKQAQALESERDQAIKVLAKNTVDMKRLQIAKKVQDELDTKEAAVLTELEEKVPAQERELEVIATRHRDIQRYANAAEGFLQMLEKSPEQLEKEDREYVLDDGEKVGRIIVDAAQNDMPFSSLSDEDQTLITDFANIFRTEARKRMDSVLEMAT